MDTRDTRMSVIEGARLRDPRRWSEFYAIYWPMLMGYFHKQGLCEGSAQDITHDVFLKLLEKIHTYERGRTRFRTWLFTVARRTLIDQARRRKTQENALEGWVKQVLETAEDEEDRQRREFERSHHAQILQFAFETVRERTSSKSWKCFEMSVIQDLPGQEVAKALGITANAVYVNSWRVLQDVKEVCQRYDEDLKSDLGDRSEKAPAACRGRL